MNLIKVTMIFIIVFTFAGTLAAGDLTIGAITWYSSWDPEFKPKMER